MWEQPPGRAKVSPEKNHCSRLEKPARAAPAGRRYRCGQRRTPCRRACPLRSPAGAPLQQLHRRSASHGARAEDLPHPDRGHASHWNVLDRAASDPRRARAGADDDMAVLRKGDLLTCWNRSANLLPMGDMPDLGLHENCTITRNTILDFYSTATLDERAGFSCPAALWLWPCS